MIQVTIDNHNRYFNCVQALCEYLKVAEQDGKKAEVKPNPLCGVFFQATA